MAETTLERVGEFFALVRANPRKEIRRVGSNFGFAIGFNKDPSRFAEVVQAYADTAGVPGELPASDEAMQHYLAGYLACVRDVGIAIELGDKDHRNKDPEIVAALLASDTSAVRIMGCLRDHSFLRGSEIAGEMSTETRIVLVKLDDLCKRMLVYRIPSKDTDTPFALTPLGENVYEVLSR
jgi:hypothetical protein